MTGPGTVGFADAAECRRAREVFAVAGYTETGLRETLAVEELLWTGPGELPPGLRRTRNGSPRETLIRLFFLGVPVEAEAARRAVHPMAVEDWMGAGLVAERDGQIAPLVKAVPYHERLFVSDMPARVRTGGADDFVLGVSKSSVLMAHTMVPRPAARALDLGTGCGILALLASPRTGRMYATDKNARAVDFAAFNARLNAIDNVELRTGDLFEPVAGMRFDLVVSNPPYVISPRARFMFCDSGLRGDEFCRQVARAGADVLEEGGYCQVMCNWAHRPGQSWMEPLEGWFEGLGCDVLVWAAETQDASGYATTWIEQTETGVRERLRALYDEWMAYYDREGIEAITYGMISLRRRRGANWTRFVKVPKGSSAPGGAHVLRRFQMLDFLDSAREDESLLEERFRLAPDVRIEQHYAPKDGGFAATKTRLHLARDPEFYTMEADATVARLVLSYGGDRRLREVLTEMAGSIGADVAALIPGGLAVARRLVEAGYLLPSSLPEA